MRRVRKKSLAGTTAIAADSRSVGRPRASGSSGGFWPQFGKRRASEQQKLKTRDLVFILRNLATLTESGVSLPKALGTLAEEKALEKHREMLHSIRRHLENGESFSTALAHYGATFDTV